MRSHFSSLIETKVPEFRTAFMLKLSFELSSMIMGYQQLSDQCNVAGKDYTRVFTEMSHLLP